MLEVSNCSPEMAVPMTVKMPEPMTAPMPSAVSDHGPRVFFSAVLGFFRVPDELIDRFAGKQLAWQCSSPCPLRRKVLVTASSWKPYAEVYMMEIGRAETGGICGGNA